MAWMQDRDDLAIWLAIGLFPKPYIVGGDEDLRIGMELAQQYGACSLVDSRGKYLFTPLRRRQTPIQLSQQP